MYNKNFFQKLWQFFFGKKESAGVFYVHGPDTLPEPLTPAEEQAAVKAAFEQFDRNAREMLISHNLRLVVYIARKFESSGVYIEDLVSIGTVGLIKAVDTFCPEKNIKLATYASRCIENEILMYLRKIVGIKNECSIDEPLRVDFDGNELLLSDILSGEEDEVVKEVESMADRCVLRKAVACLPAREQEIIKLRFGLDGGEELTQKEVADRVGISQSYISRLEKRIIRRLRQQLCAEESRQTS